MGNLLPKPPSIPPATGKEWPGWADPEEVKARLEEVESKAETAETEAGEAKTEAGEAKTAVEEHLSDNMPHRFVDGTTTYRWGLSAVNGIIYFNYEEVV